MSKWSFSVNAITPVAVADNASFTASTYMALQGGSTTQINNIWEVSIGGQATSSAPTFLTLAYDSTVGATPAALASPNSAGPMNPATAALSAAPVAAINFTGTEPKRSNSITQAKLQFSFNAFGGSAFWRAGDEGSVFQILGNTASLGEASLSAFTGGTPGPINAHIIYEPK